MSASLIDIAEWIDRFGDDWIRAETADGDSVGPGESLDAIDVVRWCLADPPAALTRAQSASTVPEPNAPGRRERREAAVEAADAEMALLH